MLSDVTRQPWAETQALQDRRLRETVALCYEAHPYYRRLMTREGIEPRHIQSCSELTRLPPTTKADFLADPEAFRIDPAALPPEIGTLWKVIYTTGTTTGRPVPPFDAHHSLDDAVRLVERQHATILWGIAGFVRRVLMQAEELGADVSRVRMAMVTGEASSGAMRDDMRARMARLGCAGTRLLNRYGCTEQGSSLVECTPGSGFHDLAPD